MKNQKLTKLLSELPKNADILKEGELSSVRGGKGAKSLQPGDDTNNGCTNNGCTNNGCTTNGE